MTYFLFIIGFVLLIKGADLLVDGASAIAKRLHVSDLIIGLTVVAFGTSLPELAVNIFAGTKGNTGLAIGNVLGSNIANVLLILGVATVIRPLTIKSVTVWKEIPFSLLAAILVFILANDKFIDHKEWMLLSRIDGLVLICFFVIFVFYIFESMRIARPAEISQLPEKPMSTMRSIIYVALGIVFLVLGGNWIVTNAVAIARKFQVSENLIGLSIIAIGTSLPELATSAVAAYKKNADIAVGNVVGSNIFNIFFVLAISAIIRPLPFQHSCNYDIGLVVLSSLLLFAFIFIGKKHLLERWQGALFLVLYFVYLAYIIKRG